MRCKEETKNRQKFKGTFSDAICNGVHATPLHRASENGRLKVVLVILEQSIVDVHSRGKLSTRYCCCVPQNGHLTRVLKEDRTVSWNVPSRRYRKHRVSHVCWLFCLLLSLHPSPHAAHRQHGHRSTLLVPIRMVAYCSIFEIC